MTRLNKKDHEVKKEDKTGKIGGVISYIKQKLTIEQEGFIQDEQREREETQKEDANRRRKGPRRGQSIQYD